MQTVSNRKGKQTFEVEIRVNTAAKPKQIDTKNLDGAEKGLYLSGYLRTGWRHATDLSYLEKADQAPGEFAIAEGSGLVLPVWKREKK